MNHLIIHPTSRALREHQASLDPRESLHTTLSTIGEFESKSIYVKNKIFIDKIKRNLFLKQKIQASLFTQNEIVFRFFEELAQEYIDIAQLFEVDTYAHYESQIEQLLQLRRAYKTYLDSQGATDRMFIPYEYEINRGYIQNFTQITLYLDGYITKYELQLFEAIAREVPFCVKLEIDRFSRRNIERFAAYDLCEGYSYTLDLSKQEIREKTPANEEINCEVFSVNQRIEQVNFIFYAVEELTGSGIAPEDIVVILPEEGFKQILDGFDRLNNFNFSMGFDFSAERYYKTLEALHRYLENPTEAEHLRRLEHLGIEAKGFKDEKITDAEFLERIVPFETQNEEALEQKKFDFLHSYKREKLFFKEFLYLYLHSIKDIRVDDVRGGKVTVMGALESRGVSFEGVVIVDFNEAFVPKVNQKDIYLNSKMKQHLGLPTTKDREALQKHLYYALLKEAKQSFIGYSAQEPKSKFLYELGLEDSHPFHAALDTIFAVNPLTERELAQIDFDPHGFIWSNSMLKIYLECSRRFYFQYIRRLQEPPSEEVNEGSIIHEVLERMERFDAQELQKLLDEVAPNGFYRKLWFAKLQPFLQWQKQQNGVIVAKEKKFTATVAGLRFQGKVDRLEQLEEGGYRMIDYKTGRIENRKKDFEKMTDFQMPLYAQLLREYTPELAFLQPFEAKLEYVTHLEEKTEQLLYTLEKLGQTKSLLPQKCEDLSKCRYCPYTLFCRRGEYM